MPKRLRDEVHKARQLGPAKYVRYAQLEHAQLRNPLPRANAPFDIGASRTIVLHETTVDGVLRHWIKSGQGIRELRAFKREACGHTSMIDVGAAAGIFSAAFCALTGGEVWAFEPSPAMLDRLSGLMALNPSFRIHRSATALGSANAMQDVEARVQYVAVPQHACRNPTGTMPVQTLDGFAAEHCLEPDFAKIDVEGMELEVLRGGAETFRRSVHTIMLEVHCPTLMGGESAADVQSLLGEIGFELFTLESHPISDLAKYVEAQREVIPGVVNIVCRK